MSDPRAASLARDFDQSFAAPRPSAPPAHERFLLVGDAGRTWAVPLGAIAALRRIDRLCVLAGAHPAHRGVAPHGDGFIAVFGMAAALAGVDGGDARWLVVIDDHDEPFALSAVDFHGHVGVAPDRIARGEGGGYLVDRGRRVPIVDCAALSRALRSPEGPR